MSQVIGFANGQALTDDPFQGDEELRFSAEYEDPLERSGTAHDPHSGQFTSGSGGGSATPKLKHPGKSANKAMTHESQAKIAPEHAKLTQLTLGSTHHAVPAGHKEAHEASAHAHGESAKAHKSGKAEDHDAAHKALNHAASLHEAASKNAVHKDVKHWHDSHAKNLRLDAKEHAPKQEKPKSTPEQKAARTEAKQAQDHANSLAHAGPKPGQKKSEHHEEVSKAHAHATFKAEQTGVGSKWHHGAAAKMHKDLAEHYKSKGE